MKPAPSSKQQGQEAMTLENTACVFMLAFKAPSDDPNVWDLSRPAFIWGISPTTPQTDFTWAQAFYVYHQCLENKAKFDKPIPVPISFRDTEPPTLRRGDSTQELLLLAALFEAYQVGNAVILHGLLELHASDANNVATFLAAVALTAKRLAAPPSVSLSPTLETYLKEKVPKLNIKLS